MWDFNPRAPCGARPFPHLPPLKSRGISIHAPLAGRDVHADTQDPALGISIHAPLAGRDQHGEGQAGRDRDFNPRAPCGARPAMRQFIAQLLDFNPRAPCGARPSAARRWPPWIYFNPRAPCGARPAGPQGPKGDTGISIHAPLAGRDFPALYSIRQCFYFNPRAPCGARLPWSNSFQRWLKFQSTRPLRGATSFPNLQSVSLLISIHAPLAGRDLSLCSGITLRPLFQSTRPLRGATLTDGAVITLDLHFNPRAPCGARRKIVP